GGSFAVGAVFAVLLVFVLAGPATNVLALGFVLIATVAVIAGWTALCKRLVGGQSGDLIGALAALLEIAVLCGLLAFV
ncbi:hypothetical protein, partial [Pseudoalteromonas fuliginea]|uniref:hypothetical protein n=1 Tax=Pseudoalteromonas fuliginea TaxID=1872678 RepID=UPI000519D18D